jgi:L-lactate dehydrogenase complex protein LldG
MSSDQPSARDAILQAARAARPPAVERPEPLWTAVRASSELPARDAFIAAATAAGAAVVACPSADVPRVLAGVVGDASSTLSYVDDVSSTVSLTSAPHGLDTLDLVVCESTLGVAENGAVWLATSDATQRAALFLAARVAIVVAEEHLVADLHEAYERIDVRLHTFGAFIAGPSKTADIEQSLVIGAHGPKELTLVLVSETRPEEIGAA